MEKDKEESHEYSNMIRNKFNGESKEIKEWSVQH